MSKIELPTATSGYNLSTINNNFQKIEDTLNQEVLYRKNYVGEPNEMRTNLDMNGNKILNVVTGTGPSDLATRGYVDEEVAEERVYVDQQLGLVNSELDTKYDKTGGPVFGDINLNGHKLIGASEVQTSKTSTSILEINGVPVVPGNSVIDPYNGTREALRRSYAEAGYNLVNGSFEVGGTLVNANDVLLHEASGKAFSGPAGTVAAGTVPFGPNYINRGDETLRSDLADPNSTVLVGGVEAGKIQFNINSLSGLSTAARVAGREYKTQGFYTGSKSGSGMYYWDATRPKSDHLNPASGVIALAPEAISTWAVDESNLSLLLDYSGSALEFGVFVMSKQVLYPEQLGAKSGIDSLAPIQKMIDLLSLNGGSFDFDADTTYTIGSATVIPRILWKSGVFANGNNATIKCTDNPVLTGPFRAHLCFLSLDPSKPEEGVVNAGILGRLTVDGNRYNVTLTTVESGYSCMDIGSYADQLYFDDLKLINGSLDGLASRSSSAPVTEATTPRNVHFNRLIANNCTRNNVSLIDHDGFTFGTMITTNANGTPPESGLDVEPNFYNATCRGLYIGHLVTSGNLGAGLASLLHNPSTQEVGTIGKIEAYGNTSGVDLYRGNGLNIQSGRIFGNVYGVYLGHGSNININAEIFENTSDGVYGVINAGWANEPISGGGITTVQWPSKDWDFSGCVIQNNGWQNVRLGGIVANNESGDPTTYPLQDVCFDRAVINNDRHGSTLTADYGIIVGNNTFNVFGRCKIGSHVVAPVLKSGTNTSFLIKDEFVVNATIAAREVPAGGSSFETITVKAGAGALSHHTVALNARQNAGLELTTWALNGVDARINASWTNYTATTISVPAISCTVRGTVLY